MALRRLGQLVELCRRAGMEFVFVHCGGGIWALVPLWYESSVNSLIPVEAHTDLVALCRAHSDMALIGSINRWKLEGVAADLEQHVSEKTQLLWAHGRAIPNADAHYPISDWVSFDNMQLYVELLKVRS